MDTNRSTESAHDDGHKKPQSATAQNPNIAK